MTKPVTGPLTDEEHKRILDAKYRSYDVVRRRCRKCAKPKKMLGGTMVRGKFICADCR